MAVQYNRLFKMMIDRKMTPAELRDQAGISSSIITHLKKDEFISVRHRKNMQGDAVRRRRNSGVYAGQRRKEAVTMMDAEQREAARQFVSRWHGKGNEDEDGRSYWLDFWSIPWDEESDRACEF